MAKNITFELSTTNLGPHIALNSKLQTSSLEIGIYANNGSGKTFISRAFRLATKKAPLPEDSNKLLTMGKPEGAFKLKITNTQEPGVVRELELKLTRDNVPVIIKNTSGYLFRVFNEDYIKENLEELKYRPDGQIEGYILGKEKIDLTKEKDNLVKLKLQLKQNEEKLQSNILAAIKQLDNLSIRKNTTEYQNFNLNNLLNREFKVVEQESFNDLIQKHTQLKSLPDNLQDLQRGESIRSTDTLSRIVEFLKMEYSRSAIAEDFKIKVKQKQDFIEAGVGLLDKSRKECPFCEQQLTEKALTLIDQYLEYLSESEAQQIKKANDLLSQLNSDKKDFNTHYKAAIKLHNEYVKNQKFIPSLSSVSFCDIKDLKDLEPQYQILYQALEKKKEDITAKISTSDIIDSTLQINRWITDFNICVEKNNKIIQEFNNKKNNVTAERLDLNRRLCRARYKDLQQTNDSSVKNVEDIKNEIYTLEEDIIQKEQGEKILKKGKVIETFKTLLTKFFGSKYSFDETTFCLKFQNHLLESNASDVLSTGEKSIVAFCYYIAESHIIIEREEDYQKLFFIIDDPISSQDFHYVYATSQVIRTLNKLFSIPRLRILLLTHNLEFMSIIIRNKIIEQKFILANGKVDGLGNELLMPYEEHLRDIHAVSLGSNPPCHTTPNSLRHILETINRFVAPDIELSSFCDRIDGFAENEFLYSLMHDGSHGGIRIQKAYTDEMVKSACEVIVNYISKDFSGQIKLICA